MARIAEEWQWVLPQANPGFNQYEKTIQDDGQYKNAVQWLFRHDMMMVVMVFHNAIFYLECKNEEKNILPNSPFLMKKENASH